MIKSLCIFLALSVSALAAGPYYPGNYSNVTITSATSAATVTNTNSYTLTLSGSIPSIVSATGTNPIQTGTTTGALLSGTNSIGWNGSLWSTSQQISANQFNGSGAGLTSIQGANVTGTVPNATTAGVSGTAGALNINFGSTLWVDAAIGNDATGIRGRIDKPFATIGRYNGSTGAAPNALPGDTIRVGPGVFAFATNEYAGLNTGTSAGISLIGSGRGVTVITGIANGANSHSLFSCGNGTLVQGVTANILGTSNNYFPLIDTGASALTSPVNFVDDDLNGTTDGLFNSVSADIRFYHTNIKTQWDTVLVTGTATFYDCALSGSNNNPTLQARIVNPSGGSVVRMYGGSITSTGTGNATLYAVYGSGETDLYGTVLSVTGTGSSVGDFNIFSGGSAKLVNVMELSGSALSSIGAVAPTYLSPNYLNTGGGNVPSGFPGEYYAYSIAASGTTTGTSGTTTTVTSGTAVTGTAPLISFVSNTATNGLTLSLPAGDWDVEGNVNLIAAAVAYISYPLACLTTTSATFPSPADGSECSIFNPQSGVSSEMLSMPLMVKRFNSSSPFTVYLVVRVGFGTGSVYMSGKISARRH